MNDIAKAYDEAIDEARKACAKADKAYNVKQRQAMCKAMDELNAMSELSDPEIEHGDAEDVLCDFLKEVGYGDLADAFDQARERVGFWYA